jgi:hypothetical protein
MCRFFLSFLYICIAVGDPINYQEGRVGIPLNGHIFFFSTCPQQGPGKPHSRWLTSSHNVVSSTPPQNLTKRYIHNEKPSAEFDPANPFSHYKFCSPTKTTSFWMLSEAVQVLFVVSLYMYCRWRSDRLSRRESWDPSRQVIFHLFKKLAELVWFIT